MKVEKPCEDTSSSLKQDEQNFKTFADKTILKTEQSREEKWKEWSYNVVDNVLPQLCPDYAVNILLILYFYGNIKHFDLIP